MEPHQRQHAGRLGAGRPARMVLAQTLFWKLSTSLPEIPLLSRPPLLFSFLTSARRAIPAAGMGDTSSSLAGGSLATPAESPAEPHSHRATQKATHGPSLPPTSPAPTLLTGQKIWRQAQLQGLLLPGVVFILTSTQAHLGRAAPPGQPILTPQRLTFAENGPCGTGHVQGRGVGS